MWTVWCDNISKRSVDLDTFTDYGVKVGKSDNIQQLRSLCHAANKQVLAEDCNDIASMRIFTDTVQPHISDPQNIHGGSITVSIRASQWTMSYFFNVLALLWAYDISISRFINGIVLTRAVEMWHVSIWYSGDISRDAKHELGNQLRLQTGHSECTFAVHNKRKGSAKLSATRGRRCHTKHRFVAATGNKAPVTDYDKEMQLISDKFGRTKRGFARCDSCAFMGTILITLVLTTLRILVGNSFLIASS